MAINSTPPASASSGVSNSAGSRSGGILKGAASRFATGLVDWGLDALTARWRRKQYRKQLEIEDEFAKRNFDREAEFSREMYNRSYEDNLPANVRKRLEEAGLNPAVFFSNGNSSGLAGSVQGASSSPVGGSLPGIDHLSGSVSSDANFLASASRTDAENVGAPLYRSQFVANIQGVLARASNDNASAALSRYDRHYRALTESTNVSTLKANLRNVVVSGNKLLAESLLSLQKFKTEQHNTDLYELKVKELRNILSLQYVDLVNGIIDSKIKKYNLETLLPWQAVKLRSEIEKNAYDAIESGTRSILNQGSYDLQFRQGAWYDAQTNFLRTRNKFYPYESVIDMGTKTVNTINNIVRTFVWRPRKSSSKEGSSLVPTVTARDFKEAFRMAELAGQL